MTATANLYTLYQIIFPKMMISLAKGKNFFEQRGLVGPTPNSPIIRVDDPMKNPGDTIRIPGLKGLCGAGVTGDNTLRGSEEKMIKSQSQIVIDQFRNGVLTTGRMDDQRTWGKIINEAIPELAAWMAHRRDYVMWYGAGDAISNAVSVSGAYDVSDATDPLNAVVFGGDAKTWAELDEADVMTTDVISNVAAMAAARGIPSIEVPGYGEVTGIMLITPGQARDLKIDENWKQAQMHANIRGQANPIFTGALGIYDDIVIYRDKRDPKAYGVKNGSLLYQDITGIGFDKAEAVFMGAGAVGYGVAKEGKSGYASDDDYQNLQGTSIAGIFGFAKTTINVGTTQATSGSPTAGTTRDYGVVYAATAARKIQLRP